MVGYFAAPRRTGLQNIIVENSTSAAAGSSADLFSPYCPSGYTFSGGGMETSNYLWDTWKDGPSTVGADTNARCNVSGVNNALIPLTFTSKAVCTRVPGLP